MTRCRLAWLDWNGLTWLDCPFLSDSIKKTGSNTWINWLDWISNQDDYLSGIRIFLGVVTVLPKLLPPRRTPVPVASDWLQGFPCQWQKIHEGLFARHVQNPGPPSCPSLLRWLRRRLFSQERDLKRSTAGIHQIQLPRRHSIFVIWKNPGPTDGRIYGRTNTTFHTDA